jgi:hypothetical protein
LLVVRDPFKVVRLVVEIPLFFQKMWENSHSQGSELVKNIGQKGSVVDFKVQTSFIGQSHDLF